MYLNLLNFILQFSNGMVVHTILFSFVCHFILFYLMVDLYQFILKMLCDFIGTRTQIVK